MEKFKTKEIQPAQENPQEVVIDDLSAPDIESENSDFNAYSNKMAPIIMSCNGSYPSGDNNNLDLDHIQFLQKSYGNLSSLRFRQFNSAIQTKPSINKSGDIYEQEADQIANQILQMSDSEIQQHPT